MGQLLLAQLHNILKAVMKQQTTPSMAKTPVLPKKPITSTLETLQLTDTNRNLSLQAFKQFDHSLPKFKNEMRVGSLEKSQSGAGKLISLQSYQSKSRFIEGVDERLKEKLQLESQIDFALSRELREHESKRTILERRMADIKGKNASRIKEIQEFEERVVAKYKLEFNKDREEYSKLAQTYNKVLEQEKLLELKLSLKKQKTQQDREKILEEQKKFIHFINNLKSQDVAIMEARNTSLLNPEELTKNTLQNRSEGKVTETSEFTANLKNPVKATIHRRKSEINVKQIGDEYLEINKKLAQKEPKRSKQIASINLKNIDYNPEIKHKIERNDKTLSVHVIPTSVAPKSVSRSQKTHRQEEPVSQHQEEPVSHRQQQQKLQIVDG